LTLSCTPIEKSTESPGITSALPDDPVAVARQATVEAMSSVRAGYEGPKAGYDVPDSPRLEGWFDVNQYFSVLNHLSLQPGYTLDYLYVSNGSGARPYLYARKIDRQPYTTLEELAETYTDETYMDVTKDHTYDYFAQVQTDGSEESFFQYVVLRIMGGQFYLWWHAGYNDYTIICDSTRLEAILADNYSYSTLTTEVKEKARSLDLAPKVEINNDTVSVRVVIFTKWGGFIEKTYTITRSSPHIIKDITEKTLVEWYINLTF
jgi:hypothetical protein